MTEPGVEVAPKKRRYRKYVVAAVLVTALVVAAIILWLKIQQPAEGTIHVKQAPPSQTEQEKLTSAKLEGKTFTLQYPSNFKPEAMSTKNSYSGVDNFILSTSNLAGNDHLAIVVDESHTALSEDSSYRYRSQHSELYTLSTGKLGGETIYKFAKTTDGYENTVFIPHGKYLATIALTSANTSDPDHATVMDGILSSFAWR